MVSEQLLLVTYTKSSIGYAERQKATVRSLGLRRLGDTAIHADSPAIRGMVRAVQHLVAVDVLDHELLDALDMTDVAPEAAPKKADKKAKAEPAGQVGEVVAATPAMKAEAASAEVGGEALKPKRRSTKSVGAEAPAEEKPKAPRKSAAKAAGSEAAAEAPKPRRKAAAKSED